MVDLKDCFKERLGLRPLVPLYARATVLGFA
jgi:hypothetical protein